MIMNQKEDIVREDILQLLFEQFKRARSTKSQALTISKIKKGLKDKGYKEQEIVGALTFLKDRGWVKEEREEKKFFIKGRLTTSEQIKYRISDVGIVHFSGSSKFGAQTQFSGINITNIRGITVVGNDNIVQIKYKGLYEDLDQLGQVIRASDELSDKEKVEYQSDIETIKSQLPKENPNKTIIKTAWETLSKLATINGVASLISKVSMLIKPFLG